MLDDKSTSIAASWRTQNEPSGIEQLDKICEALDCDLPELLEYKPNAHRITGENLIVEEHGNRNRSAKKY